MEIQKLNLLAIYTPLHREFLLQKHKHNITQPQNYTLPKQFLRGRVSHLRLRNLRSQILEAKKVGTSPSFSTPATADLRRSFDGNNNMIGLLALKVSSTSAKLKTWWV
jgi:hypothetical protein